MEMACCCLAFGRWTDRSRSCVTVARSLTMRLCLNPRAGPSSSKVQRAAKPVAAALQTPLCLVKTACLLHPPSFCCACDIAFGHRHRATSTDALALGMRPLQHACHQPAAKLGKYKYRKICTLIGAAGRASSSTSRAASLDQPARPEACQGRTSNRVGASTRAQSWRPRPPASFAAPPPPPSSDPSSRPRARPRPA